MAPGSELGATVITAGTPITIHRMRALWFVNSSASGSLTFAQATGNNALAQDYATPFNALSQPTDHSFASDNQVVQLKVYCATNASTSCNFRNNADPIIEILGTQLTLAEGVEPTGTLEGGSLTSGGLQKGSRTLTYRAADAESGVARVEALLDGSVAASRDFAADGTCRNDDLNACPNGQSGDLTVDTSKVPDGTRVLQLRITDAAGNQHTVNGGQVTLDNRGAGIGPGDDLALRGAANGQPAPDQAVLALSWSTQKVRTVRTANYGHIQRLRGALVTTDGRPIAGAVIDVAKRQRAAGAVAAPDTPVTTDAAGRFTSAFPKGPSYDVRASIAPTSTTRSRRPRAPARCASAPASACGCPPTARAAAPACASPAPCTAGRSPAAASRSPCRSGPAATGRPSR